MGEMTYLALVEARNGFITVAAATHEKTRDLAAEIAAYTDKNKGKYHVYALEDVIQETARPISTQYLHNIRAPLDSGNWHLWKGTAPNQCSVVDWYTFLYPDSRRQIVSELVDAAVSHAATDTVTNRGEIPDAFQEIFPVLAGHGLTHFIADRYWRHLRETRPHQLHDATEHIAENRQTGRDFEAFFEKFCERNGMHATPYSTAKLREHYPDVANRLEAERGHLHGVPDFFVDTGSSHVTGQQVWEPRERYAFVEVKYNQSPVTEEQEEMLQRLAANGIETWVFTGTPEQYRFHHIEPRTGHHLPMRVQNK